MAATALAYELDVEFAPVLEERAAHYSDPKTDQIQRIQGDVENLRGIMVSNIEQVLERGEQLEVLVDKTDVLDSSALVFKRGASEMRRIMWWKNARARAFMVAAIVFVLYLLGASLCGLKLQC